MDNTQTQLDPDVVNLAKATRQYESGNDPTKPGASGEYGYYQYEPATWAAQSKAAGVNVPLQQATAEQQNQVWYTWAKQKKDEGNNVGQILSMQNAGEGKPNAYLNGNSGTNNYGVKYDTADYAKKVATIYQQIKSQSGSGDTGLTAQGSPDSPAQADPSQGPVTPPTDTYGANAPAAPTDTPVQAGLKAVENVPSSLLNLGKSLFGAVSHPINTIKGIGNAFAGGLEEGYHALTGQPATGDKQTETFDALKKSFVDRYGSLENAQKTATNDPVGFGADVFSILEGGAGLTKAATGLDAVGALDRGVSAVASPVINGGEKVADVAGDLGSRVLGQSTGVGSDAIKVGYNAAKDGGSASDAFLNGLRGNTSPEDLVSQARGSLDEVIQNRSGNYKQMLGSLKDDSSVIDTTPLKDQLSQTLDNFNITKDADGKLNFDSSTIANPSDQAKVQAIAKDIESWKDNTPKGIDTLKQRIANYYEPGSKIGAFSESLRSTARQLINDTPGYTPAMKNYSELSEQIKDIKQSLSLGDKAAVETSFNKLKNTLKNDKGFRQQVVAELDSATGGKLTQSIAGQNMNSLAPKGLARYADAAGLYGAATHGLGIPAILGLGLTTSPRIVGEFVNALGLGVRGTKAVMSALNKMATPAVIGGAAASKKPNLSSQ